MEYCVKTVKSSCHIFEEFYKPQFEEMPLVFYGWKILPLQIKAIDPLSYLDIYLNAKKLFIQTENGLSLVLMAFLSFCF